MEEKMEIDIPEPSVKDVLMENLSKSSKSLEEKVDEFEFREDNEPIAELQQRVDKDRVTCLDYFEATATVPNSYKIIRLPNGFTAFLISVNEEIKKDMAYCSLCVNVGSFSDPPEFQGLAHCLEQILVQNTDPDLDEEDLNELICESGGAMENFTDSESTTFSFEITKNSLKLALSSFAQYLIRPLQEKDCMPRSQESDFKKFQFKGQQKVSQFLSSISDDRHPASKFPYADLFSLRDVKDEDALHSELVKFRDRHYSAHRMNLVLQAKMPLETLENYVKDCFSGVLVNWLPPDDFSKFRNPESFVTNEFKKLYKARTKKLDESSRVHLTWVLPSVSENHNKFKPHEYISWIFNHEGKGSLLNYLRKRKWCTGISCNNLNKGAELNDMYTMFTLSLQLTDQGQDSVKDVIEAVFAYIDLLIQEGPQERIHEEIREIKNIEFFFYEEYPLNYAQRISQIMHTYAPKCIAYITHKTPRYNAPAIEKCIRSLSPDSVNVILELSIRKFPSDLELTEVETWFFTEYASAEIPKKWLISWKDAKSYAEFHLPDSNRFIAKDFHIIDHPESKKESSKYPVKVLKNDLMEIWYRLDVHHEWPGCYVYLYLIGEQFGESVKSDVIMDLWLDLVNDLLRVEVYDAIKAGLKYEIYNHINNNVVIKIYGLAEKLPLLLQTIIKYLANSRDLITKALFNDAKTDKLRYYYDHNLRPETLGKNIVNYLMQKNYWVYPEKYEALMQLTYDQFKKFTETFAHNLYVQCLVEGNVAQQEAIDMISNCVDTLRAGKMEVVVNPYTDINQIKEGEHYCKVKLEKCIDFKIVTMNYYQTKKVSLKSVVMNKLLMDIVGKPMFQNLLSQEELGYNIYCKFLRSNNIFCLSVDADPAKFPSEFADNVIKILIDFLIDTFKNMTEEDFNIVKSSLMSSLKLASIYFKTMVDHHWYEIVCGEEFFDRFDKEILTLNSITVNDFVNWLDDDFINKETFKKLSVQILGLEGSSDLEKPTKKQSGTLSCSFSLVQEAENGKPLESLITDLSRYKKSLIPRENNLLLYLLSD